MKLKFLKAGIIMILMTVLTRPVLAQEPFVTFIEYTEGNEIIKLPKIQFRHNVDINSYIDVIFHADTLIQEESGILSSPESIRLRKEIEDLNQLLTKAQNELYEYVRSIKSLRIRLLEEADPEVEAKFRKKLKERSIFIFNLLDVIEPVIGTERLDEALSVPDPLYADVVSLLAEHINNVQKKLHTETSSLIQNNKLTLNVWCIHSSKGKEPTAIHLNNYDNLETGSFHVIDKVTFARTEKEDSHLKESVRFHEDLRELIKDIGDKDSEIRQVFRELRDQLFSNLRDFGSLFGTQDLQNLLDEIEKEIKPLVESKEISALKDVLKESQTALKEFFKLKDEHVLLVEDFSRHVDPSPLVLFEILSEKKDRFKELKNNLSEVASSGQIEKVTDLVKKFEKAFKDMPISILRRFRAKIDEFVKEKSQVWIASFSNFEKILEKYESFPDYLDAFKGLVERKSFVATISDEVGDIGDLMPKEISDVAFSEAPPTVIDIPRTNRNENDSYNLYVQIYRKGYPTLLKEYSFRIKKYGTYRKWTGNLIFVKGEWQKSFQPATSVSWILHHRSRPKETNGKIKGGGGILGNVLNLGIGLNSVVFSTGSEIEYGLGITFTLLNDILQIGYGINFQREDRRGYFFIGASLFDLLNRTRSNL